MHNIGKNESVSIVQSQDPVLRKKAESLAIKDIISPKIKKVISEMKDALSTQDDGVAIAAPQIGYSLRIFIVSGAVLKLADENYKGDGTNMIFINPEITKLSRNKNEVEEGCLSIRWKYGKVKRSEKASIKAYDENGKLFERGASGLLAQVFQHETDHLEGVLFTDKAFDIKNMPPKEDGEEKNEK